AGWSADPTRGSPRPCATPASRWARSPRRSCARSPPRPDRSRTGCDARVAPTPAGTAGALADAARRSVQVARRTRARLPQLHRLDALAREEEADHARAALRVDLR